MENDAVGGIIAAVFPLMTTFFYLFEGPYAG